MSKLYVSGPAYGIGNIFDTILVVLPGGFAQGTNVEFNSVLQVDPGGVASITDNAGVLHVLTGGVANETTNLGRLIIDHGGVANDTLTNSDDFGGTIRPSHVFVSGTANNTILQADGQEIVYAGGVANNTVIEGGLLDFKNGSSNGTGAITFIADLGGTLKIECSSTFSGLLDGFGKMDKIDFSDIAFTPGVTHTTWTPHGPTMGTLAVTDGTHTADIELLGHYPAASFHVNTDNHGGTIVTDSSAVNEITLVGYFPINLHHI
jgi:autotransporter passenger strand-loop-strand repeat protein